MLRLASFALLLACPALASSEHRRLGLFAGAGYLKSTDGHGAVLTTGVRLDVARHFAVGFDLGYGVFQTPRDFQDRWWLMPSIAFVQPVGRATLDLGGGIGLAASSGYDDGQDFLAAPFDPSWALQLIPAGRLHARIGYAFSPAVEIFTRLEVGALLLEGHELGFRSRNPTPTLGQRVWGSLSLGVQLNYF